VNGWGGVFLLKVARGWVGVLLWVFVCAYWCVCVKLFWFLECGLKWLLGLVVGAHTSILIKIKERVKYQEPFLSRSVSESAR